MKDICFNKSFASYDGKTNKGKLKVECWDKEKNKLTPRQVFKRSGKKYWFRCDECEHLFCSSLDNITKIGRGRWCPYCVSQGHKLCSDDNCEHCFNKSFASYTEKTITGKLKINCWDYERNKIKPRDIFKNCGKKYWFNCEI